MRGFLSRTPSRLRQGEEGDQRSDSNTDRYSRVGSDRLLHPLVLALGPLRHPIQTELALPGGAIVNQAERPTSRAQQLHSQSDDPQ